MDSLLLDDLPNRDAERANPTPRVPLIIEEIKEEDEDLERQVSKRDENPLID